MGLLLYFLKNIQLIDIFADNCRYKGSIYFRSSIFLCDFSCRTSKSIYLKGGEKYGKFGNIHC